MKSIVASFDLVRFSVKLICCTASTSSPVHLFTIRGRRRNLTKSFTLCQISHHGKFTVLHKLISIALRLTNQIKQKFSAKSCGARATFKNCSGDKVGIAFGSASIFCCLLKSIAISL